VATPSSSDSSTSTRREERNTCSEAHGIQQSDVSGPNFNLRRPVAIQPARYVRLELRFDF
jgi:hypothetical protein